MGVNRESALKGTKGEGICRVVGPMEATWLRLDPSAISRNRQACPASYGTVAAVIELHAGEFPVKDVLIGDDAVPFVLTRG